MGARILSGKITILLFMNTNNKPEVIGRFYFDYLDENKGLLISYLVVDDVIKSFLSIKQIL